MMVLIGCIWIFKLEATRLKVLHPRAWDKDDDGGVGDDDDAGGGDGDDEDDDNAEVENVTDNISH